MKFGLKLLFFTLFQMIAVIVSYEFVFYIGMTHGGIGAINPLDAVSGLIWFILFVELGISLYIIGKDFVTRFEASTKIDSAPVEEYLK